SFDINVKDKQRFLDGRLNVSVLPDKGADLLIGDFPLNGALWDVDVQFFPEGGDLIANVSKKVAFKAVANNGLGAKLKGQVLDGNGEIVSEFSDEYAGMGYFTM